MFLVDRRGRAQGEAGVRLSPDLTGRAAWRSDGAQQTNAARIAGSLGRQEAGDMS